jgi:hypothetical protein
MIHPVGVIAVQETGNYTIAFRGKEMGLLLFEVVLRNVIGCDPGFRPAKSDISF